jgi:hypothetical protein
MSTPRKAILLFALATVVFGAVGAASAATASRGADVSTTIYGNKDATKLKGKVSSSRKSCERNRTVELHRYYDKAGPYKYLDLGTDNHGRWVWKTKPIGRLRTGNYYAVVLESDGCDRYKSGAIHIPPQGTPHPVH